VIAPFPVKRDYIIGLDLLKLMEARNDFKTDLLEIGFQKFSLRSAQASVVHRDSPFLEIKRTEVQPRKQGEQIGQPTEEQSTE
jgi:hypothetical protein